MDPCLVVELLNHLKGEKRPVSLLPWWARPGPSYSFSLVLAPQRGPFYHGVLQRDQPLARPQIHCMFLSQVPPPFAGLVFPGEKQGLGSISSSHTSPRYGFQCSVVLRAQQDLLGTMANDQWWKFRHRAERFREKVLLSTCPFSQGA